MADGRTNREPLWPSARGGYGSSSSCTPGAAPGSRYGGQHEQHHRPSLGRIERSLSQHQSREIRLHQRRLFSGTLLRPCFCLFVFLAIGVFGFFCLTEEPDDKAECMLCCFGRVSGSRTTPLWMLWLSLGMLGVLGPLFCVFACALCQRPSKRQRMKEDFYADALLEEMLAGEHLADHYDVRGSVPGESTRGTMVFLGGLGAPRAASELHSRDAAQAGYKTIAIDMPSHGTLSAVTYSLARCERVILRVLQREAMLEERARRNSSFAGSSGSMSDRMRTESLRKDRSVEAIVLEPFLFVAYGPGVQTATHFTSRHPNLISGLFLFGPIVNLNDPGVCGCGCCSGHGCFGCGCCFGHGFGCCVNGSALIGNAPCSSIYRMRWANYLEDAMIRRRLARSDVPYDIRDRLCNGREFQVSTAIEWNYEIRHRDLVAELSESGYNCPVRVVAGATSADFIRALTLVVPHTTCTHMMRIGDQYMPVWKWRECNDQLLEFAADEVFPGTHSRRVSRSSSDMVYIDALRREKSVSSQNVW